MDVEKSQNVPPFSAPGRQNKIISKIGSTSNNQGLYFPIEKKVAEKLRFEGKDVGKQSEKCQNGHLRMYWHFRTISRYLSEKLQLKARKFEKQRFSITSFRCYLRYFDVERSNTSLEKFLGS